MRKLTALIALIFLTACQTPVPNDAASAQDKFDQARRDQAARDTELEGAVSPAPAGLDTSAPVDASPANAAPELVDGPVANNDAISDEQNFDAVADRESIESDAERIAANRQQYKVIEPTDLPARDGVTPNIVEYAIKTDNPVGVQLYRRISLNKEQRALRNCSRYGSADLAQQAFLAAGGPVRDRLGLDPDGDGFACAWNPTPFRKIVGQ